MSATLPLAILEATYRFQFLDFFAKELRSYNSPESLTGGGAPVLLVLGDSFTAGNQSYVSKLREEFPHFRWVNGGISGSGVKEALLVASARFSRFRPRFLVYQVYIGNDLVDMGYHPDWRRLSFGRNIWWTITRWFPSIPYLRRRIQEVQVARAAAKTGQTPPDAAGIDVSEKFSPAKYSERVRQYYALDPTVTDDSVHLKGTRLKDFQNYAPLVKKLVARCRPPECQPLVFVVPHKSQVSREYLAREKELGAVFSDERIAATEDYPFVHELRSALEPANVPVLNPLKFFRESEQERHLYFVNDDHLNAFGQGKLAEWLAGELTSRFAEIGVR